MPTFEKLVRDLLQTTKRVDQSLLQLQERAAQIQKKYGTRTEFERWKQNARRAEVENSSSTTYRRAAV